MMQAYVCNCTSGHNLHNNLPVRVTVCRELSALYSLSQDSALTSMPNSACQNGALEGFRLIKEENGILQWACPYGHAADVFASY